MFLAEQIDVRARLKWAKVKNSREKHELKAIRIMFGEEYICQAYWGVQEIRGQSCLTV